MGVNRLGVMRHGYAKVIRQFVRYAPSSVMSSAVWSTPRRK